MEATRPHRLLRRIIRSPSGIASQGWYDSFMLRTRYRTRYAKKNHHKSISGNDRPHCAKPPSPHMLPHAPASSPVMDIGILPPPPAAPLWHRSTAETVGLRHTPHRHLRIQCAHLLLKIIEKKVGATVRHVMKKERLHFIFFFFSSKHFDEDRIS